MSEHLYQYPIHHIAIAVKDIDSACKKYREDFHFRETGREEVESFNAVVAFLTPTQAGDSEHTTAVEIISPLNNSSDISSDKSNTNNPIQKFLEKRGEGLHHICFSVTDIEKEIARLKQHGYEFTATAPKVGAHNAKVIFIHPKSTNGVLIELREPSDE